MPEDSNGSALVALLWGLWVYGLFTFWFEHFSSLARARAAQRSGRTISPANASALNVSARCAELEAMASNVLKRCGGIALNDFLNDRLAAYEAIVAAFDAGDQVTLLRHVSPEVYAAFSDAIAAREDRHEKTDTLFALIAPPEIVAARIDDDHIEISIRFIAGSYRLSESSQRRTEERHSIDIWTFGCAPPTNTWRLIATQAGR
ncbi:TIM44-like domain-containing protein [Bradyrhizobium sp. ISRA443]|uniref:TIM44-like domain-containing protein n=1 Tax=unclassified Bradyrhizobium TaxID=2631580 RepID=UPI00247B1BB2|nr:MULTISPECIES: TIM44-like domain-containing protein [unclassified Bradyrhizobium]WGR97636.1 TIM44-like domain-containing protein [Bradyrhizobium sp. ISRA436]WGS04526.1 TIM44-like domain-containing protein [Bradyrhizobium sp. ISRA437]WGS11407.1 TIM44-like domain-containing protein [Bradyrhizobium sp. ISRA443]